MRKEKVASWKVRKGRGWKQEQNPNTKGCQKVCAPVGEGREVRGCSVSPTHCFNLNQLPIF
jgi:hypothetical protein